MAPVGHEHPQRLATRCRQDDRLATAFSFFEYARLDDDHLVYEGSTPKGGKIVVHDFQTQTDAALEVPAGAGLSAVPSYECVTATVETGEDPEGN